MEGVIGNLKICYVMSDNQYEEIINPKTTSEFCLKLNSKVKFRIEEITYIEDTVYEVVLSLIEPLFKEDEFIVSSGNTFFSIEEYGITGYFSLCFLRSNK